MKRIALLLALVLLLSLFAGCHSSEPTKQPTEESEDVIYCPAPLTKEIYCQLFPSKAEYWNPNHFWSEDNKSYFYCYYGLYNGYGVMTQPTTMTVVQIYTTTIAGYTFITNSSHLFACKADKMIHLDKAYEQGLLTKENIETIYNYHRQTAAALYEEYDK